jgi:hypothetical protein
MNPIMRIRGISELMPLLMYVFEIFLGFSAPILFRTVRTTLDRNMTLNGIPIPNKVVNP